MTTALTPEHGNPDDTGLDAQAIATARQKLDTAAAAIEAAREALDVDESDTAGRVSASDVGQVIADRRARTKK